MPDNAAGPVVSSRRLRLASHTAAARAACLLLLDFPFKWPVRTINARRPRRRCVEASHGSHGRNEHTCARNAVLSGRLVVIC